jgi:hypothetical protein
MRKRITPNIESADVLARLAEDFDYHVEIDDFLVYELGRLIEEDRATFEDEEFRRVIDEGIRVHVEESLESRAELAARLRKAMSSLDEATQAIAKRTIRALEDMDFPLHNVSLVVRSYTSYMFGKLQDASDQPSGLEDEARITIERWQNGQILREEMTRRLKTMGRSAVGPVADLLFDAPDDHDAAEVAIDTLAAIPSSSSARVLTHAIVEPILAEDLELKAYDAARAMWPLPRHYILYTVAPHTHEDLPFRWFQLLVDVDELGAVDLILDEVLVHSEDPAYREDLKALLELLHQSRDPDVEEKVVALMNTPGTSKEALPLLETFVAGFRASPSAFENPWSEAARRADLNKKYLVASRLYDAGKIDESRRAIDEILKSDPDYPFAVALKNIGE